MTFSLEFSKRQNYQIIVGLIEPHFSLQTRISILLLNGIKMDRPRRKSFFAAQRRILKLSEEEELSYSQAFGTQLSQVSTQPTQQPSRSRTTQSRNTNVTSKPNDTPEPNKQKPAEQTKRKSRLMGTDEPQSSNQIGAQRRTRSKSRHSPTEDIESQPVDLVELQTDQPIAKSRVKSTHNRVRFIEPTVSDESQSNNTNASQRRTRSKSPHSPTEDIASQSIDLDEPQTRQIIQTNQRRTRSKSTHERVANSQPIVSDETQSNSTNAKQRRTRSKSTHNRAEIIASPPIDLNEPEIIDDFEIHLPDDITESQSAIPVALNGTQERGRPARRLKRLIAVEERDASSDPPSKRHTRSKSIQQQYPIDQAEVNNNDDGNERQTRSSSAQRCDEIAATRQAEPSQSPNLNSNRMSDVPETSNGVESREQNTHSNQASPVKIDNNLTSIAVNGRELNDVVNFRPAPNQMPATRDFRIKLIRLDSETIKRYLGIRPRPTRRLTIAESIRCDSPAATKIINRRCTVNIDRVQIGQQHQNDEQSQPIPSPSEFAPSDSAAKSNVRFVDSGVPTDRVESGEIEDDQMSVSTYFSEPSEKSSEISVQDNVVSPSLLMYSSKVRDDIGAMDVDQCGECNDIDPVLIANDDDVRGSRAKVNESDGDADSENDSDDNASTYCSGIPGCTPIELHQLLISQTSQYLTWEFDRSSTNSIAVQYDAGGPGVSDHIDSRDVQSTLNKCFIDSPHISYGNLITYGNETFAVNCLDHGDEAIQHHFLSKFSRSNIHALDTYFNGNLWVTEITGTLCFTLIGSRSQIGHVFNDFSCSFHSVAARLYLKFSAINERQLKILEYYKRTAIGNAFVTAVEAPQ